LLAATAAAAMLAACSGKNANENSASGVLAADDTAAMRTGAATPAAGPGVHVTRTDGKSVTRATRYELTNDNFSKFLAAADSIVALEGRDSTVSNYLGKDLTDAGSTTTDAGLKYLEANDAVSRAINSAGISVKDYFVQSIAIAAAERFMSNPKSAPPTPTLSKNAQFLRSHTADLTTLNAQREGRPVVVVKP